MNPKPLENKVAVITGASRGIGAEIAVRFAENGASVAIIYAGNEEKAVESAEKCREFNADARIYRCNVADAEAVAATFKEIAADFKTIDILVNNAGITRDRLVPMMKQSDFTDVVDVNLTGAFNTVKAVYPIFMRKRAGKIINITSVVALGGNAGQVNYAASKAGLIGLTKSVAKELGSRGVCCNAIAPGFIETDMTASQSDNPLRDSIPMKRTGKPSDVAELALFLASGASDYITGEIIRVDGGLAM